MRDEQVQIAKHSSRHKVLLGLVIVLLLAVVQVSSPSHAGLWWRTFYEALHAPVFGLIAVFILFITPPYWHWRGRVLVTLAAVASLSILSEAAQIPLPNRNASFADILNDWAGALAILSIAVVLVPHSPISAGRGRYLLLVAALILIWPLKPLAGVTAAYWERYQQLPSLVRFESRRADTFFRLQNAQFRRHFRTDAETTAAEIRLGPGAWPGIIFSDLWSNWQPYEALVIVIENPDAEHLPLNIRVHDQSHKFGDQPYNDRFNRRLQIAPGLQTIRTPLTEIRDAPISRKMDLSQVDGIVIFGTKAESGRRFLLYEIRLE